MTEPQSTIHRLRLAEVVTETDDARTLVFDLPDDAPEAFRTYRPGQFVTLRVPSERTGSVARCYSLCSAPGVDERPAVTVKRTVDGYASNWLCDHAEPGMELQVLEPSGAFTPPSLDDDILLYAAGSGITPIMSIIRSVLTNGSGRLRVFYANRSERDVIFRDELNRLVAAHGQRISVVHWLESVQGLPAPAQIAALAFPYRDQTAYICGPRPYMAVAQEALLLAGVPRNHIHIERFISLGNNPFEDIEAIAGGTDPETNQAAGSEAAIIPLTVDLNGETHELEWHRDTKMLDAMLAAGLKAPFSCREGQCSACACRLLKGEVRMLHNEVLEDVDLEEGIRLSCQSLPTDDTERVSITYH